MKNKWSSRDQAELDTLQKRKAAFESEARAPLMTIAEKLRLTTVPALYPAPSMNPPAAQVPWLEITKLLAANADALRDALEPFDSGVRCAGEVLPK